MDSGVDHIRRVMETLCKMPIFLKVKKSYQKVATNKNCEFNLKKFNDARNSLKQLKISNGKNVRKESKSLNNWKYNEFNLKKFNDARNSLKLHDKYNDKNTDSASTRSKIDLRYIRRFEYNEGRSYELWKNKTYRKAVDNLSRRSMGGKSSGIKREEPPQSQEKHRYLSTRVSLPPHTTQ